jgi:hypothetical protein
MRARLPLAGAAVLLTASLVPGPAAASQLVGRNARDVQLRVSRTGKTAVLSFRAQGHLHRVRAWGAMDARAPTLSRRQVQFKLDYSGGPPLRGGCGAYDGPKIDRAVAVCGAPDGSYWAAQSWPRIVRPGTSPSKAVWELHLSHWRGATAKLMVKLDWALRRYDDIYGQLTYQGQPVHGFHATPEGAPLDSYGRNLYLDTFDSSYGSGWRRENGFLARQPNGAFCYSFYHGKGSAYRLSVVGPGVTPDVFSIVSAPGPYDRTRDLQANAEQRALLGSACY